MKNTRKNKKLNVIIFLLFFLLLLGISIYYFKEDYQDIQKTQEHVQNDGISFSLESGVYHQSIQVELGKDLSFSRKGKIYYTLNGDDPTNEDLEYTEPITLEIKDNTTLIPIKAVIYQNNEYSKIYESLYVLDSSSEDYALPIVSVTIDNNALYDEEYGIFYDSKNEDWSNRNVYSDGDEWIRKAHLTIFDSDGTLLVNQGVGMSVSGGTSVESDIKSFSLKADLAYDEEHDKIKLQWFTNGQEDSEVSFISEYSNIKLRSGSQDKDYGNIRSSLVSRLAQESNFDGCTYTQRCIVYLNGEIFGIFDMQEKYSNSYLKKHFGLEGEDCVVKYKGSEQQVLEAAKVRKLFLTDLNDEENRKALEEVVDMDNFLLYYAINILDDNTDWPGNNYGAWKYTSIPYEGNDYSDGRLRFLIFDTDLVYYKEGMHNFFNGSLDDIFNNLMSLYNANIENNRAYRSIFYNVMQSDYYSHQFVTIVSDLLNTSFETENVLSIVDEEYEKVDQLMKDSGIDHYENADDNIEELKESIEARETTLRNYFVKYFGIQATYKLVLLNDEGINVNWNQMKIYGNEDYECEYYRDIEFTMKATAYPGYEFICWEVNGRKVYSDELEITRDMIQNQKVQIKTLSKQLDQPTLIISELSAKDDQDWFKITNVGTQKVALRNYYLSDNFTELDQYRLPDITLKEGESIIINGKKNTYAMGNYISTISLNMSETLYLTDGDTIIDFIIIPNMSKYETYGRYLNSNTMKYFVNDHQQRRVSTY